MDRKTAADILNQPATPAIKQDRFYRTHPDKLAPYWSELHGHFKDYVDQRLRLRGSREFESKDEWIV